MTSYKVNGQDVEYTLSNKDVVPFNAYLIKMFKCHINVEICSSLKVIKYLLWYPFKGDTRVIASVEGSNDEIKLFEDMRTVGASDALWKLYNFNIHERYPSVLSLNVDLENQQMFYFEDKTNLFETLQSGVKINHLEAFFLCNCLQPWRVNKDLTFLEFPTKFTFNKTSHAWSVRKYQNTGIKKQMVGRLPLMTPQNGDIFYLHTLLAHFHPKGKKSFKDMKKENREVMDSYKDGCITLGLIDNDKEWKNA